MVLFLECVIACILFGVGIVGSVIKNPVFWLHDFAPAAQKKFLSLHPEYTPTDKKESLLTLIAKKVAACILFVLLLLLMVYLAGARDFWQGFLYCYLIWFVVNLFDLFVLDLWLLARWKKCRLPGTEDMDEAYRSNNRKHILDCFWGMVIGLVVALIVGAFTTLLF